MGDAGRGGGAYVSTNSGPVTLQDNNFLRNNGGEETMGGGLYLRIIGPAENTIEGNRFEENVLGANNLGGGGVYASLLDGMVLLSSNFFYANTIGLLDDVSPTDGSGLHASLTGSMTELTAVNNVFTGQALVRARGTAFIGSSDFGTATFTNNTIFHNDNSVCLYVYNLETVNIYNNLLWGGGDNDLYIRKAAMTGGTVRLHNNDMKSYYVSEYYDLDLGVNINADPSPLGNDYMIGYSYNPLVDAGENSAPALPDVDIEGGNRIQDGNGDGTATVDIGAHEFPEGSIDNLPPTAPELVWPVEGDTLCEEYHVGWNSSTDPDGDDISYEVYVCRDDATFSPPCNDPIGSDITGTAPATSAAPGAASAPTKWASYFFGTQVGMLLTVIVLSRKKKGKGLMGLLILLAISGMTSLAAVIGCEDEITGIENRAPVADAGPDRTIYLDQSVILDGSGSYDPDGDRIYFLWEVESYPEGSAPQLSDADAESPEFSTDMIGEYIYRLQVRDSEGVTVSIDTDLVTITVVERPEDCEQSEAPPSDLTWTEGLPLPYPGNAGTWFWKVKAVDSHGASTESEVEFFIIEE